MLRSQGHTHKLYFMKLMHGAQLDFDTLLTYFNVKPGTLNSAEQIYLIYNTGVNPYKSYVFSGGIAPILHGSQPI